jgi:hypothetical protein
VINDDDDLAHTRQPYAFQEESPAEVLLSASLHKMPLGVVSQGGDVIQAEIPTRPVALEIIALGCRGLQPFQVGVRTVMPAEGMSLMSVKPQAEIDAVDADDADDAIGDKRGTKTTTGM